jgi:hypothetical protein
MTRALRYYEVSLVVSVEDNDADNPDNELSVVNDAIDAARRLVGDGADVDIIELVDFYQEIKS